MDIQGKIWIPRIGWIHGHAVLDDYSRYPPAFTYFPDTKANNIILTLHRAIEASGVPEISVLDVAKNFIKNIPHGDSTQSSPPLPKKQSLVERVRICPVPIDLKDPDRKIYRRKRSSNGHLHVRGRTYFQDDIRATFVRGDMLITQDEAKLYIFDAKGNYLVYEPLFYMIKTNGRGDFFFYHYIFSLGEQWSQTLVYLTFGCHSMWVYNEEKVFITMVAYRDACFVGRPPDNFYEL